MGAATQHVPVLLEEVLSWLKPSQGGVFVDGTLGGAGHTKALLDIVEPQGRVVALDRDPAALQRAEDALAGRCITIAQANFCDLPEVLDEAGIELVDGILLDLGLSSDQLADDERGFSFSAHGDLDLRFDPSSGEPAWRLLARLSEKHLADVLFHYGDERFSRRIARAIVAQRRKSPVRTASQLAELIARTVPPSRDTQRIHPATRSFQALRIAVNDELAALDLALRRLPDRLAPGGHLAIISFHSLEDRRVKQAFRDDDRLEALVRTPIVASDSEKLVNPRSRSARLRVAQRRSGDAVTTK